MGTPIVTAVDGPSGTGKSTVARALARRLGARYLDTGAMYRAATVAVLQTGVDPEDPGAVAELVGRAAIEITTDPDDVRVSLEGMAIDADIRTPRTTAAVSAVSAVPEVRRLMVDRQRALIEQAVDAGTGIVVEGRDIGSEVWPAAQPKIYLTASPEQRALRRARELPGADAAEIGRQLATRDRLDSTRVTSPLRRAADAVELDTSELSIEQVVDRLAGLCGR